MISVITRVVSFSSLDGIRTKFPDGYFPVDLFPLIDVFTESVLIIEYLLLFSPFK